MLHFIPQEFIILIVDDNKLNLRFLVDSLGSHGYQISFATSGKEALRRIEQLKPDIILLDLMMPEMDGFEVIKSLKNTKETVNIPVIFITTSLEENNIVKAFELGAVDYITKPLSIPEVLARLKNHLSIKQQQLKLEESEAKLNTIVTNLFDGILIVDKQGTVLFVNPAATRMLNKKKSELINYNFGIPIIVEDVAEIDIITSDRTLGMAEITINETQWQGQEVYLVSLRDITQRKRIELNLEEEIQEKQQLIIELEELASIDSLTNIYNRRCFFDILKKEFGRAIRYQTVFSLLALDVDNFKLINDTYGHSVGDHALLSIVKEISRHLREADYFGRLGGDEFVILLPETDLACIIHERIKNKHESLM
ncbi:diguanylate cyclase, partial [Crocosphaera sp. Alani8]|uniref:diguanylate cyclase n=1 Tax=Crocosphaera sp. Alani8 TaxID=3038952 RepID=UPI00313C83A1